MAENVHSKYDGVDCNPHPWTEANKGPTIFDLIIELIIAIIEDILDTETTYLRIDFTSGEMTVFITPLGLPQKLSQEQFDKIAEVSKETTAAYSEVKGAIKTFQSLWSSKL